MSYVNLAGREMLLHVRCIRIDDRCTILLYGILFKNLNPLQTDFLMEKLSGPSTNKRPCNFPEPDDSEV